MLYTICINYGRHIYACVLQPIYAIWYKEKNACAGRTYWITTFSTDIILNSWDLTIQSVYVA